MRFTHKLALPAATALVVIFSNPAFALDGDDLIAKISATFAAQGGSLTAEETVVDGDTVTARGVMLTQSSGRVNKLPLGEITFEGVQEQNGGYLVDTVRLPDVDTTDNDIHVSASGIEIDGLRVPAAAGMESIDTLMLYDSFKTGPVFVEKAGKTVASIASFNANLDVADDQSGLNVDGAVSGLNIHLSEPPSAKSKAIIEALKLQNISGDLTFEGAWEVATGKIDINEYALDLNDIGKLNINASISGYTFQFAKALRDAQAAMAANPDKKAGSQAFGLTMMGLMQQLSLNGASIRFDDASITKRVLDFFGKQQGVTGEQMAQMVKGMAPIMLMRMNMPDLQAQISAALNTYLDNPQSIEIKAAPAQPVPAPAIMGAAMGAPQTLPQLLGVTVTANQ